jgi:hypothetical protein
LIRQLGRIHNTVKEDFAPKTFTKQEVGLKTRSSYREIPIPDYVFEAILKERRIYEKTETAEKKRFRIWIISVVPHLAGQGAKGFTAGIISSFLLKVACRTSAGMICAAHIVRFC